MASAARVCVCGCRSNAGADAHWIMQALAKDDLDAAIEAGLLVNIECDGCSPSCRGALAKARAGRHAALAARARFRAREARLARRRQERMTQREAAAQIPATASSLPPAAAAALARARARALGSNRK